MRRPATLLLVLLLTLLLPACHRSPRAPRLPTPEQARALFARNAGVDSVALSGNVVQYWIRQPTGELRRGGSLWAQVGPYVYLFTPSTRQLFTDYPDVGGVRVVTVGPGGAEIARALLPRDTMSDILWRRSLNILGHALQEGTKDPARLDDLVKWGERHTSYSYNPKFVPR